MQGYIISMQKTRTEDMIVRILTPRHIKSMYRFYGARHSIINIGHKIDFEEQPQVGFLPKLTNLMHLSHKWEFEHTRLYIWQHFIKLLSKHLFEIDEVEEFYFELLEWGAHHMGLVNPKRVVLEMYARLLKHEGRAHVEGLEPQGRSHGELQRLCFVCQEELDSEIALGRAFLFAHHACIGGRSFQAERIEEFLLSQSSIRLEDGEIEHLWEILCLGL